MPHNDDSIRKICVAAVRRHTIHPIDYPLTRLFGTESIAEISKTISDKCTFLRTELPIALTFVNDHNWTLVTTRKIITILDGELTQANANKVTKYF